jgi:hypothetical protein
MKKKMETFENERTRLTDLIKVLYTRQNKNLEHHIWIPSHHSLNVFTYVDFLKLFFVRPF